MSNRPLSLIRERTALGTVRLSASQTELQVELVVTRAERAALHLLHRGPTGGRLLSVISVAPAEIPLLRARLEDAECVARSRGWISDGPAPEAAAPAREPTFFTDSEA